MGMVRCSKCNKNDAYIEVVGEAKYLCCRCAVEEIEEMGEDEE